MTERTRCNQTISFSQNAIFLFEHELTLGFNSTAKITQTSRGTLVNMTTVKDGVMLITDLQTSDFYQKKKRCRDDQLEHSDILVTVPANSKRLQRSR